MTSHAIVVDPRPTLPIAGSDLVFPLRRVYCIGRNYAAHAREMGGDPTREPPFFFNKTPDALQPVAHGVTVDHPYPPRTENYHHEIEMLVALRSGGRDIPREQALDCVFGYAVGLDMTRRDLQGVAKKTGRPWEVGKAFDKSLPITALVPADKIGHPKKGAVWLDVNGERRQTGDLEQMIWSIPEQIEYLSGLFELKAGDLIMTGTPAGVSACKRGDRMKGHVDGVGDLDVVVV